MTGDDLVEIYELRGQLSKEFKIKDLGRLKYFWVLKLLTREVGSSSHNKITFLISLKAHG